MVSGKSCAYLYTRNQAEYCYGDAVADWQVPRPDGKPDLLGLKVLDEPAAVQSDPSVLTMQLRQASKQVSTSPLYSVTAIAVATDVRCFTMLTIAYAPILPCLGLVPLRLHHHPCWSWLAVLSPASHLADQDC